MIADDNAKIDRKPENKSPNMRIALLARHASRLRAMQVTRAIRLMLSISEAGFFLR